MRRVMLRTNGTITRQTMSFTKNAERNPHVKMTAGSRYAGFSRRSTISALRGFSFWDSAHAAETGWFRRRLWGWRLAVGIITTQVLGDLVNFLMGDFVLGGTGFTIAGALLFYLLRPEVRAAFERGKVSGMR